MDKKTMQLLNGIAQSIYDKKGTNILVLDVKGVSTLTDYVVIAEGNIDRHVKALSIAVRKSLEELGSAPLYVEGERTGDWVVIDCGEVVVHLLVPEFRERYSLEGLWRPAKVVDIKISTQKQTKEEKVYD